MEVIGKEQVLKNFKVVVDKFRTQAVLGLGQLSENCLKLSQYYCPVDTRLMVSTGHIEKEGTPDGFVNFRIVYGISEDGTQVAPYTVYVHEDLTKHHEYPTQAKWLERAARETARSAAGFWSGLFGP